MTAEAAFVQSHPDRLGADPGGGDRGEHKKRAQGRSSRQRGRSQRRSSDWNTWSVMERRDRLFNA